MSQHAAVKKPAQPTASKKPTVSKKKSLLRKTEGPSGPTPKGPIQAKVEVHESDDQYEQEADRVADMVVGMQAPAGRGPGESQAGATSLLGEGRGTGLQRKGESLQLQEDEEEDEPLQLQEDEEEDEPLQLREDEEEDEPLQLREDEEEDEPLQLQEDEEEDEPLQLQTQELQAASEDDEVEDLQTSLEEVSGVRSVETQAPIQRACASCGGNEDEELQEKTDDAPLPVQRACSSCGSPGDEDDVQLSGDSIDQGGFCTPVQAKCASCEAEEELQKKPETVQGDAGSVQTAAEDGEDELQPAGGRRKAPQPGAGFEERLNSAKQTGGAPLPNAVRDFMEPRFGASFENVRVHTDSGAHELTRSVGARAFATGHHLFFKKGAFQPHSHSGRHLIAHELTHVLQQRGGLHHVEIQRDVDEELKDDDDQLEGEFEIEDADNESEDDAEEGSDADVPEDGVEGEEGAVAGGSGLVVNSVRQFEPSAPQPRGVASASTAGAQGAKVTAPSSGAVNSASNALEEAMKGESANPPPGTTGTGSGSASKADNSSVSSLIGPGKKYGAVGAKEYTATSKRPPEDPKKEVKDNGQPRKSEKKAKEETFDAEAPDDCPAEKKRKPVPKAKPPANTAPGAESIPTPAAAGKATREPAKKAEEGLEADLSPIEKGIVETEMKRGQSVQAYVASDESAQSTRARAENLEKEFHFKEDDASTLDRSHEASRGANEFFSLASAQLSGVVEEAQTSVPEKIGAAAEMAKASLGQAISEEKEAISTRVQAARVQAYGAAASARATVNAQASAFFSTVEAQTQAAIGVLEKAYKSTSQDVAELKDSGLSDVNSIYKKGHQDMVQVGKLVGQEAHDVGETYAEAYSVRANRGRDNLWDGFLTRRRARAQMAAARKTASGYQEGFQKSASKQAVDLARKGRRKNRCTIISAESQYQEALTSGLTGTKAALLTAKTNSVRQAKTARDGMLASINSALAGALTRLDKQEREQRQSVNDMGYLQQATIEHAAHASAAAVLKSVTDGANQALTGFEQMRLQLEGSDPPDPLQLSNVLSDAKVQIENGTSGMREVLTESIGGVTSQLDEVKTKAASSLAKITSSNDEQASKVNEGFATSMSGIVGNANGSFAKLTTDFTNRVRKDARAGVAGLNKSKAGMKESADGEIKAAKQTVKDNVKNIAKSLRKQIPKMQKDIPRHAYDAAAKEAPAWKKVLAVVLIIVVVVAVIALAFFTAGASLSILAVALIGAGMGAATSALIYIAQQLWTNQPINGWDLAAAVAVGAVTGFLGGAVGAWVGTLVSKAHVGIQLAVGFVADLAFDLAVTFVQGRGSFEQLTWGQFFTNLGIMVAATIIGLGAASLKGGAKPKLGGAPDVDAHAKVRPGGDAAPDADVRVKADADAETKVRAEAEAKAKAEAEAKAKAEAEAKVKAEAEAKAKAEAEAKAKAEAEAKAKAEAEAKAKAKAEAEAKAKANGDGAGRGSSDNSASKAPEGSESSAKMTPEESRVLKSTKNKNGNELTPDEVQAERRVARRGKRRAIDEPPYTSEADLPNDHKLKDSDGSGVKRCSEKCGIYDESGKLIGQEPEGARKQSANSGDAGSEAGGEPPVTQKITDAEAESLSPEEVSARVKEGHASEWAVNPKTGEYDPKLKMQGLSPEEVDIRARNALARKKAGQPETEPLPDPVRRRMRHIENTKGKPMPMKDWAEAGNRANVNRDLSRGPEIKAVAASGGSRANVGEGRKSFTTTETVDGRNRPSPTGTKEKTVTTVPDGTRKNADGGFDIIEHKHFTGNETVLNDSAQLRAQRKLASSPDAQRQVFGDDVTPGATGKQEIVMTSETPIIGNAKPTVKPSEPLGKKAGLIRYFDLKQNRFTHRWNSKRGNWVPLP